MQGTVRRPITLFCPQSWRGLPWQKAPPRPEKLPCQSHTARTFRASGEAKVPEPRGEAVRTGLPRSPGRAKVCRAGGSTTITRIAPEDANATRKGGSIRAAELPTDGMQDRNMAHHTSGAKT